MLSLIFIYAGIFVLAVTMGIKLVKIFFKQEFAIFKFLLKLALGIILFGSLWFLIDVLL